VTCIKHFPGHGRSALDSHVTLPVLSATVDQLREKDLAPFARGIEAGADSVMVGHISPLDRCRPASLDQEMISGLLRGELKFDGVVITDALEMAGAWAGAREKGKGPESSESPGKSLPGILKQAVGAGNDILLFSKPVEEVFEQLRSAEETFGEDEFWGERLADCSRPAVSRIERLLQGLEGFDEIHSNVEGLCGGKPQRGTHDLDIYREIAEKSARIVRRGGSVASLKSGEALSAVFCSERGDFERPPARSFVARALDTLRRAVGAPLDEIGEGRQPTREFLSSAAWHRKQETLDYLVFGDEKSVDAGRKVLFLLNRRPLEKGAIETLSSDAGIVIVAGWPYAAHFVPPDRTTILTYGVYDAAAERVGEILANL
jgi:beta-glucosidase-like glycosyl hydrolase